MYRNNNNNKDTAYVQSNGKSIADYNRGAQIYQERCVSCHQANGLGISGVFPPLKGSDFLKNSTKKRLIEQVMNGSNGGLVVNNVKYSSPMPPQVNNETDAIAVVNYILNSWGNHYGIASPQDVKGIKKTNNGGRRRHMMMNKGMMMNRGMMRGMNMFRHRMAERMK